MASVSEKHLTCLRLAKWLRTVTDKGNMVWMRAPGGPFTVGDPPPLDARLCLDAFLALDHQARSKVGRLVAEQSGLLHIPDGPTAAVAGVTCGIGVDPEIVAEAIHEVAGVAATGVDNADDR